jgi:hypothetical protein
MSSSLLTHHRRAEVAVIDHAAFRVLHGGTRVKALVLPIYHLYGLRVQGLTGRGRRRAVSASYKPYACSNTEHKTL